MSNINLQGQQTVVNLQTHDEKKKKLIKLKYTWTHSVAGVGSVKGLY